MNFPKWLDFALFGAIIGLGVAFGAASWRLATIAIPAAALAGAAFGVLTNRRGRRG